MAVPFGFSAAYAATSTAHVAKSQKVLLESLEASLARSPAIRYAPAVFFLLQVLQKLDTSGLNEEITKT
jgi:hypothetical protein